MQLKSKMGTFSGKNKQAIQIASICFLRHFIPFTSLQFMLLNLNNGFWWVNNWHTSTAGDLMKMIQWKRRWTYKEGLDFQKKNFLKIKWNSKQSVYSALLKVNFFQQTKQKKRFKIETLYDRRGSFCPFVQYLWAQY